MKIGQAVQFLNQFFKKYDYGLLQASTRDMPIFTFIPIKILGGGHLIYYDRKLLYILGIKKNHITSGFSGGKTPSQRIS